MARLNEGKENLGDDNRFGSLRAWLIPAAVIGLGAAYALSRYVSYDSSLQRQQTTTTAVLAKDACSD
jgi:hypothetical protein